MPDEIRLEWTYEPADLFEERAELLIDGTAFVIDAGTVICRAPFEGDPAAAGVLWSLCNELHQRLAAMFLAAQTLGHKAYTLSGPKNAVRLCPDGGRHFFALLKGSKFKASGGDLDAHQADAAGKVLVDTRAARIIERKNLAQQAATHIADPVASSILRSYSAAVADPHNELIHLYEIRDALQKHFGSAEKAKKALNVSSAEWTTLGRLACNEPLVQGRHRGQHLGALRDAAPEELTEARAIARRMIKAYLALL